MIVHAIWKYTITPTTTLVEMPRNAQILSVCVQANRMILYAKVIPGNDNKSRRINIYETGEEFDGGLMNEQRFIGTCMLNDGNYVCHVFEPLNLL